MILLVQIIKQPGESPQLVKISVDETDINLKAQALENEIERQFGAVAEYIILGNEDGV